MLDDRSERMNAKIRDAQNQKIPYMLVVGDKGMEEQQIALRLRNGENPGPLSISDFIAREKDEIARKVEAQLSGVICTQHYSQTSSYPDR